MDKYAFFIQIDNDSLKNYDIGPNLPETYTRKSKPPCEKYETEVDCSGVHMNDHEYAEHMRTLNKKTMNCQINNFFPNKLSDLGEKGGLNRAHELCLHVMHQLEEEAEPMHLFIEGGGGVGKTCLGHALKETVTRYYRKQVGEIMSMKLF